MIILYFRVAIVTQNPPRLPDGVDPWRYRADILHKTVLALVFVFLLYLLWDATGILMGWARDDKRLFAWAREGGKGLRRKYPKVENGRKTSRPEDADWVGMGITLGALVAVLVLYTITTADTFSAKEADWSFCLAVAVILGYRFAKELRTSWKQLDRRTA
jgi:hypothetical protein